MGSSPESRMWGVVLLGVQQWSSQKKIMVEKWFWMDA